MFNTMPRKKTIKAGLLIFDAFLFILAIIYGIKFKSILFTFFSFTLVALILTAIFWNKIKENLKDRTDVILVVLASLSLFLYDIVQNLISILGTEHIVNFAFGIVFKATLVFWIALLLMIAISLTLFVRAIMNNKGKVWRDAVFGGATSVIAIVSLFGGALMQFYLGVNFPIAFFHTEMATISFYHVFGIALYIESFFYYLLTR